MELFTPWHFVIVVIVGFVLFFGWKQLPDMARSVGRSLRIFKTEVKGMTQDDKQREQAARDATVERRSLPAAEIVRTGRPDSTGVTGSARSNSSARPEAAAGSTRSGVASAPRPRPRPTPNGRPRDDADR
jgi:sec-independent protein translocase protein TatA